MRRAQLPLVVLAVACSSNGMGEVVAQNSSPIVGGRPSGSDEDATVLIETRGTDHTLHCSGRVLTPSLVVTARHCVLREKPPRFRCNPDGTPVDVSDPTDLRPVAPSDVAVRVGSARESLETRAVREVLTTADVTLCRADVAFLVLVEPLSFERTPLATAEARIGDTVGATGWGYTGDGQTALPLERSTREAIAVVDVGPGLIPDGTFAVAGASLCFGDSGAAALRRGALLGVYSRIDGEGTLCSLEQTRNIFTAIDAHRELVERAYAAVGERPWYEGQAPPWLAAAGAPCDGDAACASGVCDRAKGICVPPCGEGGAACPAGQTCSPELAACVPEGDGGPVGAASPDEAGGGCIAAPSPRAGTYGAPSATAALVAAVAFVAARVRSRRR